MIPLQARRRMCAQLPLAPLRRWQRGRRRCRRYGTWRRPLQLRTRWLTAYAGRRRGIIFAAVEACLHPVHLLRTKQQMLKQMNVWLLIKPICMTAPDCCSLCHLHRSVGARATLVWLQNMVAFVQRIRAQVQRRGHLSPLPCWVTEWPHNRESSGWRGFRTCAAANLHNLGRPPLQTCKCLSRGAVQAKDAP